MPGQKSPLELLIALPKDGSSADRREFMRLATDRLLAAPDRYGIREMEFFDLLYSSTGKKLEQRNKRLIATALTKAGMPKETVAQLIYGPPSMLGQILRRSATQPLPDLVGLIREKTRTRFGSGSLVSPAPPIHLPEHRFTLPDGLLTDMNRFIQLAVAREVLKVGKGKLAPLVSAAVRQNTDRIIREATEEARDELLEARNTVQKHLRTKAISEDFIAELIDTGHHTQFMFALINKLEVDAISMLRILNDGTWESMALACRSARLSRHCFSKIINSMHRREDDNPNALRIMGLYDKIPDETADRAMRFWQVRVSALKETAYADLADHEAPANSNDDPAARKTGGGFGRAG